MFLVDGCNTILKCFPLQLNNAVCKAGYGRRNGECVMCEDGYYSASDQDTCINCGNNKDTGEQTGSTSSNACGSFLYIISAVVIFTAILTK